MATRRRSTPRTTAKRRNPADLTGRNLRAVKKVNVIQDVRFQALVREIDSLRARMRLLELVVDGILGVQAGNVAARSPRQRKILTKIR